MRATLDELGLKYKTDKASNGHNYTPIYERYLAHYREHPFVLWEIGIGGYQFADRGGESLRMWREYFTRAKIAALDLFDKAIPGLKGVDIYQGSQGEQNSFYRMHDGTGKPNVIIDDASHVCALTIKTFELAWPLLAPGGFYFVEDVHTSYWTKEYGGHQDPGRGNDGSERADIRTTMDFFQDLTHQLNHYTLLPDYRDGRYAGQIEYVHFFPELIIIKKL